MFGVSPVVIFGLLVLNVPVYYFVGKAFFGDWEEFLRCVKFWLTPDAFSFFSGQYSEDRWSEMKLGVYFFVIGLLISCEVGMVGKLMGTDS